MGNKVVYGMVDSTSDKKPITFHVLPERSDSLINAIGSVQTTHTVVRDCMESFFRGAVEERVNKMGLDKIIKEQTDRRIEIAIKQVMTRVENELCAEAMKHARERLRELVNVTPMRVRIETGAESEAQ